MNTSKPKKMILHFFVQEQSKNKCDQGSGAKPHETQMQSWSLFKIVKQIIKSNLGSDIIAGNRRHDRPLVLDIRQRRIPIRGSGITSFVIVLNLTIRINGNFRTCQPRIILIWPVGGFGSSKKPNRRLWHQLAWIPHRHSNERKKLKARAPWPPDSPESVPVGLKAPALTWVWSLRL